MSFKPTILFENEYCWVVNNETGELELIEGPRRFVLPPNKSMFLDKTKKMVIKEGEYIVVSNPYDPKTKRNILGASVVIKGPTTRSLFPQETSEGVKRATILVENEGAVVMAKNDFGNRKAGERWIVRGPSSFIPTKNEKLIRTISATQVSQNECIYVRNTLTSELKLVKGPVSYMPEVDEELYEKKLSEDEIATLKCQSPSHFAFQIQIQKNEAVCVVDRQTDQEKYVLGPNGYLIGPHEGVKVITRSGGLPKKEGARKLAVIRLGPDFMADLINVRTKDNAVLEMHITYKWRFILNDKELYKIFHGDFVGYSCQSMRSRIREEVSRHDFENFHTNSASILREKLFKDYQIDVMLEGKEKSLKFRGRFFKEFNFLIFQLDVKKIRPVDKDIEKLLDNAIKSSMKILVKKKQEGSEFEQKRSEIKNKIEIERLKTKLIELENQNIKKRTVERSRIDGQAKVETAKAESHASHVLSQSALDLEMKALGERMVMLRGSGGDEYINYVKSKRLGYNTESITYIPEGTQTLVLGRKGVVTHGAVDEEELLLNMRPKKNRRGRRRIRM